MKEESGGKKVDQFREIYMWEREPLYLILSFILSQWRDFRIQVIVMYVGLSKFMGFGDSTSSRVQNK